MRASPFHRPGTSRAPGPFWTRTLRDPWSLVVAGVGMFCIATVVGVVRGRTNDLESSELAPRPLRAGTVQANLVNTVHDYRVSIKLLQQPRPVQAVAAA